MESLSFKAISVTFLLIRIHHAEMVFFASYTALLSAKIQLVWHDDGTVESLFYTTWNFTEFKLLVMEITEFGK